MTQEGYAFLGLTAIVAALVAIVAFALMRFIVSARETTRRLRDAGGGMETALLSAALQDAVAKLKAQEQATAARATASEELSGEIVESLTAGLLVVDRSGRVEIFNAAGRRMLGLGEAATGDYHDVLAAAPPLVAVIEECLTIAQPIVRRTVQLRTAERVLHFGVTVSPLGTGGPDGPPLREGGGPPPRATVGPRGVICLFSDLTDVVDLEEQLRLKETLARLGELTAGIAHEFRNGLATIHGYSRLIDPGALPAKYQPYVEGIRQEAEALGKVVTNFLNFARPEQVSFSHVDLGVVAQRAADDLRHELPQGTALTVSGRFGDVVGDEVLLRQVFGNLIRNAAEACEGAGRIPVIAVRGLDHGEPAFRRVVVEDNGPGIPPESRDRIFQPFFTTRSRGTGLGLAIVQKIIVMHNGRVSAGERDGGGASIQVTLPAA